MFLKMELASPAALAAKASPVPALINWMSLIQAIAPNLLHVMTPLDQTLAEIGADVGVPAHLINTTVDRAKFLQATAQMVTPAIQGQLSGPAGAAPPPPPNGAPAQPGL